MRTQQVLLVEQSVDNSIRRSVQTRELGELKAGMVRVQVEYSALNYKDALAATGNPGVARTLPLVPGIDAVGKVVDGPSRFSKGENVMVAHPDFGTAVDGGFATFVDVADDWLFPVPPKMSTLEAVTLGTAGFTAAQCVDALVRMGMRPRGW
jgi:acrylyl-CoA reductase (NADPH)